VAIDYLSYLFAEPLTRMRGRAMPSRARAAAGGTL